MNITWADKNVYLYTQQPMDQWNCVYRSLVTESSINLSVDTRRCTDVVWLSCGRHKQGRTCPLSGRHAKIFVWAKSLPPPPFPFAPNYLSFPILLFSTSPLSPEKSRRPKYSESSTRGLGQSPIEKRIWCILALKCDIWWHRHLWFPNEHSADT